MSSGSIDSFERTVRLVEFGNFWHKSVDHASLEDQDKQRIRFFVIRFTVKYSDRLVTTAALKVLDFQLFRVLGYVRLSLRLCKILVQFVTFYTTHGSSVCFLTLVKLTNNLDYQSFLFCLIFQSRRQRAHTKPSTGLQFCLSHVGVSGDVIYFQKLCATLLHTLKSLKTLDFIHILCEARTVNQNTSML